MNDYIDFQTDYEKKFIEYIDLDPKEEDVKTIIIRLVIEESLEIEMKNNI
jgi:hypothetical protein